MGDKVVLGYWAIRGLAQPLRFYLEYLGLPYEDKRYYKPEEWFADVTSAPLNQHVLANLPYIQDGDELVFESQALYVYLAYRANKPELLGQNPKEQVALASVRGVLQDLFKGLIALFTIPEDQFEAKKEEQFNQLVFWIAEKLSKFLENRKWAVGDNLTYIDFQLFEAEEILRNYKPEAFATLVGLKNHNESFANLPAIKNYQASDKMIARPFYPPGMYRWG
ncbi:unnamed protein product [Paramecium octaurelia]|uniref:glutathione transferase n=1 Tax=Paramecium octaurelia TaxID=43137 RepID=A0A8S1Y0M7_PAROT|nr:unnamed protein product [Paramecium octaurelia]